MKIELKTASFRRVIGIRCHTWGVQEEEQYNHLLQYFSADEIFFILDTTKQKTILPPQYQTLYLDKAFIIENGLLDWQADRIGWLCGDYFYYVFRKQVEADFYWLIEPDVYLNFENLNDLFGVYEEKVEDALLPHYKQKKESEFSSWHKSMSYFIAKENSIFVCLFPFHRLSAKAIDICFEERRKMSTLWRDNGWLGNKNEPKERMKFVNDEVFVATIVTLKRLKIASLSELMPDAFSKFHYKPFKTKPYNEKNLFLNKIFHPVKINKYIVDQVSESIIKNLIKEKELKVLNPDSLDIDYFANSISHNIRKYIFIYLTSQSNLHILKQKMSNFLCEYNKREDVEHKVWVYDSRYLVIDLNYNGKKFSIDFIFDFNSGEVSFTLFCRNDDLVLPENISDFKLKSILKGNKKAYSSFIGKEKTVDELESSFKTIFTWFYQCILLL